MSHPLAGRKQSPEQIAKRVESTRLAKSLWDAERVALNRQRVSASAKGRASWLKGKKGEDYPEHLRKINSECHKGIQAGEKHPMYGKHHTEDARLKNSLAHKGIKQSVELIMKRVAGRAGYTHSEETKAKIGMANRGDKNGMFGKTGDLNPTWLGGISFEPYPVAWTFALRESIRNRDERKCCICGAEENGKRHDVHHIDYDKKNIAPQNLITLCVRCHRKTNYNREEWTSFFTEKMEYPLTGTNS